MGPSTQSNPHLVPRCAHLDRLDPPLTLKTTLTSLAQLRLKSRALHPRLLLPHHSPTHHVRPRPHRLVPPPHRHLHRPRVRPHGRHHPLGPAVLRRPRTRRRRLAQEVVAWSPP